MQCDEFESRMQALLDRRADPRSDARLAQHARSCGSCSHLLLGQQALLRGLRQLPTPPLPASLARRVVERAGPTADKRSTNLRRVWQVASPLLTAAAAVLIAAWLLSAPRRDQTGVAANGFGKSGPYESELQIRHHRAWLIEAPRLPDHLRGSWAGLPDAFPLTPAELDQVEQFAPGIRPIRLSLTALWDAICQVFPGGGEVQETTPRSRTSSWWLVNWQLA